MNRRQFEELRRWGRALRRDEREELQAAGEAIRLLCGEVDRLERELSAALLAITQPEDGLADAAEDTLSDEPELIESSLRGRLQRRLAGLHRSSASPDPEAR